MMVNAIVIGGQRHGEWVELLETQTMWIDLKNAATHRVRPITWVIADIRTGEISEQYALKLCVHADFIGPQEQQVVTQLLSMLAMNDFARNHGERKDLQVPDSPAELLGPDGGPVEPG